MKSRSLLFCLLATIFATGTFAQTTLVLQPDSTDGIDAILWEGGPSSNYGASPINHAEAWTFGGQPAPYRSVIRFDLSSIPQNVVINSATLSLYFAPQPDGDPHSTQSGSNACKIQRIKTDWQEFTVTWGNQPQVADQNHVVIPQSTSNTQDYPNIDVTAMVQDMVDEPDSAFGFMLRLVDETPLRRMTFGSSDNADTTTHPKLEVTYTVEVGVAEGIASESFLNIYPNPSSDYVTVEFENRKRKAFDLVVYDVRGIAVKSFSDISSNKIEFRTSDLTAGIYFLQLRSEDKVYGAEKLIVE